MSKEPVFVSIVSEAAVYNNISGKFIFHSMKNKAGAYVRDGEKVPKFNTIPVLRYQKPYWFVADSLESVNDRFHYWLKLQTQGLLYLGI